MVSGNRMTRDLVAHKGKPRRVCCNSRVYREGFGVTHQGWSEATEILDHFLVRYPDRGLGTTRRCGMAVYLRFDFSGLLGMVNVPAQAVTVSETAVLFPPQK